MARNKKQKEQQKEMLLDGQVRTFRLNFGKPYVLTVDGEVSLEARSKWYSSLIGGDDFPFSHYGHELRLTTDGTDFDVVKDGVYLGSGKKYVPAPKWIWAFIIALVPLVFVGGAIGAIFGLVGAAICAKVAKSAINTVLRVLLCLLITGLSWVGYLVIGTLVAGLIMGIF